MRKEIIGDCELYLGDCLEVMPTIENVDAVVTDPPYGIGENSKKNKSRGGLAKPNDYGDYDWDNVSVENLYRHITSARSRSKYQIIFGGNYYDLPPTSCWLVWDKLNGNNDFADCELAWTNLKQAVRVKRHLWNGMLRAGEERNVKRVHPTQKPIEVMRWCIEQIPACQTILDPFMGSGTTGVACVKLGRKFIGIELEEKYFDIACKRIEDAYKQPDMFIEQEKPKIKQESLELGVDI
jgi:site-specific DNA-methyltransferase (adenine-specific)/modification methylase